MLMACGGAHAHMLESRFMAAVMGLSLPENLAPSLARAKVFAAQKARRVAK